MSERGLIGLVLVGALAVMTAGCSVFGGRAAPEPAFEVEVRDGDFEIRRYGPMAVAVTAVEGESYRGAVGSGFMRLFDYIQGANEGSSEIAMTAPVLTEPQDGGGRAEGAEIAMTAPVLSEETASGWEVAFVLPAEMTAETAPRPTDDRVEIRSVPARRVAAVRFSGFLGADDIARERARLMDWIAARGETAAGPAQAAGYNPPWTLPFLRRNEVIVPLE